MSAERILGTLPPGNDPARIEIVGFRVSDQLFGIPVADVRDVLKVQQFAAIPLAQPEILGSLNLRGRVATVVDLRRRLGLPATERRLPSLSVVVEQEDHLYALLVDSVGDVMALPVEGFLPVPATLPPALRAQAAGVAPTETDLLVLLEVARVLTVEQEEAA